MTTPLTTTVVPKAPPARHPLTRLYRTPRGLFGVIWLGLLVVLTLTTPLWIPYGTTQQDPTHALSLPSAAHWLGTDELGRDLLTRIFAASGQTLLTSAIAVIVTMILAIPLALLAASRAGRTKSTIERVTELVMALPGTVIMIAFIGAIGVNLPAVMALLGVMFSAGMYRIFIGQATAMQKQLYVDAARVDGLTRMRISLRHVLPGMTSTILAQSSLVFAIGLMIQVGLAFIGFGAPIPQPSWGGMIAEASQHVYDGPWLMVPIGVVLALTVLAANAIGDVLSRPADEPQPQIAVGAAARRRDRTVRAGSAVSSTAIDPGLALKVKGLSIGLESGQALVTDVSLHVRSGTVLGLVGESGCGKTLTALSLIGLLPPGISTTDGSILWEGRDLARMPERELLDIRGRQIALISQEPMRALDPMFTVGYQLVGAVRRLRGLDKTAARAEAVHLLERVGIVDPLATLRLYPHQISGGMAQRVAIALALAGRPRLLVADEPTTALDVTVQAETLSLLRHLIADTGMSMVIVTHDLGVVADICDDVAVMYAGQVVESGPVIQVLDAPAHPYTMALLAADPHTEDLPERLTTIPGQVPQPADWPRGCRFADRCTFATPACLHPVTLTSRPRTSTGTVRCVRAAELAATEAMHEFEQCPGEEPAAVEAARDLTGEFATGEPSGVGSELRELQ